MRRGRSLTLRAACTSALAGFAACGGGPGPDDDGLDPRIRWVFEADAEFYYGSPALSADEGTVFVGTSTPLLGAPSATNALHAVAAGNGAALWTVRLGRAMARSTPAIGADGSITFVAEEYDASGFVSGMSLRRVSATGAALWTYALGLAPNRVDIGYSAPALAPDGTIYVASDALYAVRPDGTLKWKFLPPTAGGPFAEDLRASPVVAGDGTVYFASHNVPLTALHPDDGRVLWSLPLGVNDHVLASPAIGADGTVYVTANGGVVFAVSPAGAILWAFDAAAAGYPCTIRSSPAVAADGTIYFGSNERSPAPVLFALRPDGTLRWVFEPSGLPGDVPFDHFDIYSSPAIGSDGTVYFGMEFGRVYAVDPSGGSARWMVEVLGGITWSSPALASDGTLFIGDLAGRLYAIATESRGLQAGSPWPRYRHDNRSTGARSP